MGPRGRKDGWGDAKLLYEDAPEGVQDLGIQIDLEGTCS